MVANKDIFCVKCGSKNTNTFAYCIHCGAKLVRSRDEDEEERERKCKEEDARNRVTLKNMHSKISCATFIIAKVIIKLTSASLKPRQPTEYDGGSTKAFIILSGSLRYDSDVTDEVKKKILNDIGTDLDVSQVEWSTDSLISSALNDKGWHAVCVGWQWYVWPMNGSTIRTLVTVNYKNGVSHRKIVKGEMCPRNKFIHDQISEETWSSIVTFLSILFFIGLAIWYFMAYFPYF